MLPRTSRAAQVAARPYCGGQHVNMQYLLCFRRASYSADSMSKPMVATSTSLHSRSMTAVSGADVEDEAPAPPSVHFLYGRMNKQL